MNDRYKTSWYNSPRLMLGLFIIGLWEPFMLIPALIVFLLHCQHYHALLSFAKQAAQRDYDRQTKEFAAEDIIRNAKLEANQLISHANSQKTALEIEILELKKEVSALTSQIIENSKQE